MTNVVDGTLSNGKLLLNAGLGGYGCLVDLVEGFDGI
jgi:hypothetical protein